MQTQVRTKSKISTTTKTIVAIAVVGGAIAAAAAGVVAAGKRPVLQLRTSSSPSGVIEYIKGADDAIMYGLDMRSNRNFDLNVTEVTFTVLADSDGTFSSVENDVQAQDHIDECSLIDTNTGTVVAGPATIDASNLLTFTDQFTLPSKQLMKFNVECDLSTTDPVGGIVDIYAFTMSNPNNIQAEHSVNGTAVPNNKKRSFDGKSGLNPNGSRVSPVINGKGQLDVSEDASAPDSRIVVAGTSSAFVGAFRFDASSETYVINSLELQNCLSDAGGVLGCPDFGQDNAISLAIIEYTNSAGVVVQESAFLNGGSAIFANQDISVPKDDSAVVNVYVDTPLLAGSNASAGDQFRLNLIATGGNFSATGQDSGELEDTGMYVLAEPFTLHETVPTLSVSASSPAGAGFVPSDMEVLRFNVSANAAGDVDMLQYLFQIDSTDASASGWNTCANLGASQTVDVYNVNDFASPIGTVQAFYDQNFNPCSGGSEVVKYVWITLGSSTIAAGSTESFAVFLDSTGASTVADDVILVRIPDQEVLPNGFSAIGWTYGSGIFDGNLIEQLPVQGGAIQF